MDESTQIAIPVLLGPTASGKTALTEQICERYPNVEIVSADSRQVYIGMDIGTAKPSAQLLEKVPHHLIDLVAPDIPYSAGKFARDATHAIESIMARGNVPLISGGTGFYVRALFEGLKAPPADQEVYAKLEERMNLEGYPTLLAELYRLDPRAAGLHPPENRLKTLRALTCYYQTGTPYSDFLARSTGVNSKYRAVVFCLMPERDLLYERINDRVISMVDQGLIAETDRLISKGYTADMPGMKTVGYREAMLHLAGELSFEETIASIQQATRRYAKRQVTWFRGQLEEPTYAENPEGWESWIEKVV